MIFFNYVVRLSQYQRLSRGRFLQTIFIPRSSDHDKSNAILLALYPQLSSYNSFNKKKNSPKSLLIMTRVYAHVTTHYSLRKSRILQTIRTTHYVTTKYHTSSCPNPKSRAENCGHGYYHCLPLSGVAGLSFVQGAYLSSIG